MRTIDQPTKDFPLGKPLQKEKPIQKEWVKTNNPRIEKNILTGKLRTIDLTFEAIYRDLNKTWGI